MADTSVSTNAGGANDDAAALWGPYWTDESTAVVVYIDGGNDLNFSETTDKGANWAETEIMTGTAHAPSCWFDQETPGDSGTLVHITWMDEGTGDVYYRTLDASAGSLGTLGTQRTVDAGVTPAAAHSENRSAITKTVSGNIIIAISTQTEIECYRSTDGFDLSNDAIADVFETGTEEDYVLLFPAATTDDDDAAAIFWDRSVNDITIKMWDETAGTWTEFATAIDATATDDSIHINMDGAVRHSDSHIQFVYHNNDDNSQDDIEAFDLTVASISTPVITAKTNVVTNQAESAQVAILINQQNDDVYVAYLQGGTWGSSTDVVYHKSTDDMANWEAESAYSETTRDYRRVQAGRTVGDSGGRWQPIFFDEDDTHVFVNEVTDVEIAAVVTDIPNDIVFVGQAINRSSTY